MKKNSVLIFVICFGLLFIFVSSEVERMPDNSHVHLNKMQKETRPRGVLKPDINFGKIPLYFTFNKGQVNKKVLFYARASRYTLWITKEGLVFDSQRPIDKEPQRGRDKFKHPDFDRKPESYERDVSWLMFLGANKNPEIIPVKETQLTINYFKGNDRSKWFCDVPTTEAVLYKNIYKNIDLKVYGIEKQIEYDWIVKQGGDPGDIRFEYKNVKETRIDKTGNLAIKTDFGELMHKKPYSYQKIKDKRSKVDAVFEKVSKNTYGFKVRKYNKNKELIIDPFILLYSTYLGGNRWDFGEGIDVDNSGNAYVTGSTWSTDFPCKNQYQTNQGNADVFVTKIDTTQSGASSLVYSTYLGGSGTDYGRGIAVDSMENAYVTGKTYGTDFPIINQYQTNQGNDDVFVTKIDTTQSGASSLVYSTYLGGSEDDFGLEIALDNNGNAYVTGSTWSSDFPVLNQYQTNQGNDDVFVTKIDTTQSGASSLVYSTYLGGSGRDSGSGIAADNSGNAYVTGSTWSSNFPCLNQYQTYQGNMYWAIDAFVTKIDTTKSGASSLIYSTYLGGSGRDNGSGIVADNSGNAYVTGSTWSSDFPCLNQYQTFSGVYDVFITRINTTQSGASSLVYSTYLGGSEDDYGRGIAVDSMENAYVTGFTRSSDFPIINQYQTNQGNDDVFVTKIDTTQSGASSLVYSTFLGGNFNDFGSGIAVDSNGCAYVTGQTHSIDFPILNQYQMDQGSTDVFVTKLIFDYPPDVSIVSPEDGSTVKGKVNVEVKAADDFGVAQVNFYIDRELKHSVTPGHSTLKFNKRLENIVSVNEIRSILKYKGFSSSTRSKAEVSDTYIYEWDTTKYKYGNHTVNVIIYDTLDQQATAQVVVKVDNSPTVSIIQPENREKVKGKVEIKVQAEDDDAVKKVVFFIDDKLVHTDTTVPYSYNWDTLSYFSGDHIVKVIAYDSGNQQSTDEIVVKVENIIFMLHVSREVEKAWIIKKQYAKIDLMIKNPGSISILKFIIYRKVGNGNYQSIGQVSASDCQSGTCTYFDKYLEKEKIYTYQAEVLNPSGVVIARSGEETI